MNLSYSALLMLVPALALVPVKLAIGSHIALSLREHWPEDFKLVGSPRWSEVFWPGATPGTFYWSILAGRYRRLPSFRSGLSRHYLACRVVSWVHLVLVSLFLLLILWQLVLWPAIADIGSRPH